MGIKAVNKFQRTQRKYWGAISSILLLVTLMLPNFGYAGYKGAISLAKATVDSASVKMQTYIDGTLPLVIKLPNHAFEKIGHRAGSYTEFPKKMKNFNGLFPYTNVTELMDRSFTKMGLSGVEIDVGTHTNGLDDVVYIVHDKPKNTNYNIETVTYFERNTLEKLLAHYINEGYHTQDKRIYLELKTTTTRSLSVADSVLVARTMATIAKVIDTHPNADQIKKNIHFASFSFYALEEAQRLAPFSGHEYYLIGTTNKFKWLAINILARIFAPSKSKTPIEKLRSRIQSASWLTGIWFDLKYIKNYTLVFNTMNQTRLKNKLNLLRFAIAVYGPSKADYFRNLANTGQAGELTQVSGLIFDFQIR